MVAMVGWLLPKHLYNGGSGGMTVAYKHFTMVAVVGWLLPKYLYNGGSGGMTVA